MDELRVLALVISFISLIIWIVRMRRFKQTKKEAEQRAKQLVTELASESELSDEGFETMQAFYQQSFSNRDLFMLSGELSITQYEAHGQVRDRLVMLDGTRIHLPEPLVPYATTDDEVSMRGIIHQDTFYPAAIDGLWHVVDEASQFDAYQQLEAAYLAPKIGEIADIDLSIVGSRELDEREWPLVRKQGVGAKWWGWLYFLVLIYYGVYCFMAEGELNDWWFIVPLPVVLLIGHLWHWLSFVKNNSQQRPKVLKLQGKVVNLSIDKANTEVAELSFNDTTFDDKLIRFTVPLAWIDDRIVGHSVTLEAARIGKEYPATLSFNDRRIVDYHATKQQSNHRQFLYAIVFTCCFVMLSLATNWSENYRWLRQVTGQTTHHQVDSYQALQAANLISGDRVTYTGDMRCHINPHKPIYGARNMCHFVSFKKPTSELVLSPRAKAVLNARAAKLLMPRNSAIMQRKAQLYLMAHSKGYISPRGIVVLDNNRVQKIAQFLEDHCQELNHCQEFKAYFIKNFREGVIQEPAANDDDIWRAILANEQLYNFFALRTHSDYSNLVNRFYDTELHMIIMQINGEKSPLTASFGRSNPELNKQSANALSAALKGFDQTKFDKTLTAMQQLAQAQRQEWVYLNQIPQLNRLIFTPQLAPQAQFMLDARMWMLAGFLSLYLVHLWRFFKWRDKADALSDAVNRDIASNKHASELLRIVQEEG
ncbi:hypothetical protein MHM98_13720 [Psychrobium sp. MM17-31]|uniref:hypothetical protein n=1 Tax=Psychrobium sp. MM17-31 TaxID=2917758 RepID=UPI001EF664E6|nr:hypothetical protein [Psychrobium sp. MM17-31]MCG7532391.1 hypothetical protein [Psychrobium sp. MM17-31]